LTEITCDTTVVLNSSHQTHTPQVQKITLPNTDYGHKKTSHVILVKHVLHSLRMDHKGSETCRSF